MSSRLNWDSPNPSPASEYAPPPSWTKRWGGGHTRLRVGGGGVPIPTTVEKAQHSAYSVPSLHIKRFTITHNKLSPISTDGQLITHSSILMRNTYIFLLFFLTSWILRRKSLPTKDSDVWTRDQVKMFKSLFHFDLNATTNRQPSKPPVLTTQWLLTIQCRSHSYI